MSVGLLVASAGPGNRLGRDMPKGLVEVAGVPLVVRTLRCFESLDLLERAVVVVPRSHRVTFQELMAESFPGLGVRVVEGGAERQASVAKGLAAFDDDTDLVAIHDAARPFIEEGTIRGVIDAARTTGAATAATPCVDTILESDDAGMLVATPDRSRLWACQTPQAFGLSLIQEAHKKAQKLGASYTDDATLVRAAGHEVKIVEGTAGNIKITTEDDLAFAEYLIREGAA